MPKNLNGYLVIGVSSRALFNFEIENQIFDEKGVVEYCKYQVEHEEEILKPGVAFNLVKALLKLNDVVESKRKTEVVMMSRNSPDTSLRIFKSCEHYDLDITKACLVSGAPLAPYLRAYNTDLFLSAHDDDVQAAFDSDITSAIVYPTGIDYHSDIEQIRIAFDGDAVLFSDESEQIYQNQGLEAFLLHEKENAKKALPEGPFAKLLKTLSFIQNQPTTSKMIRTALVTARNSPAHERVIRTLREWDVRIDEAFFMGGIEKTAILKAFNPHIFFDDQDKHIVSASGSVPSARVPIKKIMDEITTHDVCLDDR